LGYKVGVPDWVPIGLVDKVGVPDWFGLGSDWVG